MTQPKPIHDDYPINALVVAVIIRAQAEAAHGDRGALAWLRVDGKAWAQAIGIDLHRTIDGWIATGCRPAPRIGRRLADGTRRRRSEAAPATA